MSSEEGVRRPPAAAAVCEGAVAGAVRLLPAADLDHNTGLEPGESAVGGLQRFTRVQTVVFLGLWLWFLVDGRSRFFTDPGTFWHPAVGRHILTTGQFPHADPFSFTRAGRPWIASQWLGECGLALLQGLGGLDGILLGMVTMLAGFYTWVAHRLIRAGAPWWFAVLLVALAIKSSAFHFYARPHLATIVLLGWTVARLCDFEAGRIPLRGLMWLVPVMAVWSNVHGGVLGGIGTIALAVAGWAVAKLVGLPSPVVRYRRLIPLGGLILGCGLATLANPYGPELLRTWAAVVGSPVVHERILEHVPIVRAPYAWPVYVFAAVYLVLLLSVPVGRVRLTWLLPLAWAYLAWTRVRNGPLFATVTIIVLADVLPAVRWSAALYRWGDRLLHLPDSVPAKPGWRAAVIPAGVVVIAVGLQIAGAAVPLVGHGWARLNPGTWPVDLLPELREYEARHPPGTPIFNDMKFGGFLIAQTPGLRVFIDDRCELYGDDWILAYSRAHEQDPAQVDRWARRYGFDRALVVTGSSIDWYLRNSGGWRVVGETTAAALHERITVQKFPN
jgi:hypothetical protein